MQQYTNQCSSCRKVWKSHLEISVCLTCKNRERRIVGQQLIADPSTFIPNRPPPSKREINESWKQQRRTELEDFWNIKLSKDWR